MTDKKDLTNIKTARSKSDLSPTDLLKYALLMDDEATKNFYYGDVKISGNRRNLIKEALSADADPNVGVDAGTALMWAKDAEEMKLLIEAGADVNAEGGNKVTALMGAGKEETRLLLANGADVNAKDSFGKTALMYACANGDIETIKVLIEAGADYNAKDKDGKTAMQYARTSKSKEGFFKALSTCIVKKYKTTALCNAVIHDDVEEAQRLLTMGVDVNFFDYSERSALSYAKTKKMANLLIACGADVNAKSKWGNKALYNASEYGRTEVVKVLLENGAHVDRNAVSRACENYRTESLKLLINEGGYDATEALYRARDDEMVDFLLKAGADVNARDEEGRTALMCMMMQSQITSKTVKLLLKAGVDVNARDNQGKTALMYSDNPDLARLLIKAGADVNARDNQGKTALMCIYNESVQEILIEAGADVFIKDKKGKKASDYTLTATGTVRKAEKEQFLADKRRKLAKKIGLGNVKFPEKLEKAESKVSKVVANIRAKLMRD